MPAGDSRGFRKLTWRDRLRLLFGARLELQVTAYGGGVGARVQMVDFWGTTPVCMIGTPTAFEVSPHDAGAYQ